jgi:HlyD family secretion protein
LVVLVAGGAGVYARFGIARTAGVPVTVEGMGKHDIEAVVSASGKIRAQKTVNISAETMGKVVNLSVAEGQAVKKGQLLLEIDPRNLETTVQNRQASLDTARSTLEQNRVSIENSRVSLTQARDTLKRSEDMWKAGLLARDQYEKALNDVKMRETDLRVSEQMVRTQEQRIKQEEANLESARYDLNKVRVLAPIDGLITARNIEEGETAVLGTMNNAGTVLLTVADMSVIETEIDVDETDIPFVSVGQSASVAIDAFPDKTFPGKVTEVGNSPIQTAGAATGRATNFKVVVQIVGAVPDVRPGFTCTTTITTATRKQSLGVPIQAMTVRELVVDEESNIVKPEAVAAGARPPATGPAALKPGQSHKEFEGVFIVRDGKAEFTPVATGIAGEKYFEVLKGLKDGDQVITGPFSSVRMLKEGDVVNVSSGQGTATAPGGGR